MTAIGRCDAYIGLAAVILLTVLQQGCAVNGQCTSPWIGNGEFCYLFNNVSATVKGKGWQDGRVACKALGGDLLSILDQKEQTFITDIQTADQRTQHYWIGLSDQATEGTYVWSDKSILNFTNWNTQYGEPNNWGGNEDCAEIHHSGMWNDNACFREFGYICKRAKDVVSPTTVAPLTLTASPDSVICEVGWKPFGGSCYKFVISYRSWREAKEDCETRGGALAIINNEPEQLYLAGTLASIKRDFWIGLSDNTFEGHFFWVDGSVLNYTQWGPGEPSNAFGGEDCVEMYSVYNAGTWNDNLCTTRRPYICEKKNGESMCPEDWISYGGSCYQVNSHPGQKTNWQSARAACQAFDGADLVTIDTMNEQTMLLQAFNDVGIVSSFFWTGLNDRDKEGQFVWADKSKRKMNNWAPRQPSTVLTLSYDCVRSSIALKSGAWSVSTCYRSYHYVCEKKRAYGRCHSPLGLQSVEIGDSQLSSSSFNSSQTAPAMARLDLPSGAWCAKVNNVDQWLQVDLGEVHTVGFIAMQGRPNSPLGRVSRYYVQFGMDGLRWDNYGRQTGRSYKVLYGNSDANTSVEAQLTPPLRAKFVRIRPLSWKDNICLRMELYGCLAVPTSKCGRNWLQDPASGLCYQVGHKRLAWQTARANCLMQNADLVSLRTVAEMSYVERLLKNYSSRYNDFWFGLNDRDNVGIHRWSDGSPVSLVKWQTRNPMDDKDVKDCASISSADGSWTERPCSSMMPYLCRMKVPSSAQSKRAITGNWISATDAYWPLNAVYEATTVSGSTTGSVYGSVTLTSKPFKKRFGLKLDGKSAYLSLGSFKGTCISSPDQCILGLTMSFLVKVASTAQKGYIIDILGNQPSNGVGYSMYMMNAKIYFTFQTATQRWRKSTSLRLNIWNHVVFSFGPGIGLRVHINNAQRISSRYGYRFPKGSGKEVVSDLVVGRSASSNNSFSEMEMMSLAIWKRILRLDEVSNLYYSEMGGCRLDWIEFGGNCYQFNLASASWYTAQRSCQSQQSTLASISSSVQQAFVHLNTGKYGLNSVTWIGLNSRHKNHMYNWTDGSPVLFTNWAKNEPNNYGSKREDCTVIWANGRWNDEMCWTRQAYACIKPKGLVPFGKQVPDTHKVVLNQYRRMVVGCPLGTKIQIDYAMFGNEYQNCSAANALETLRKECDKQASEFSCSMYSGSIVFGNPCPGIRKSLTVNYTCVEDSKRTTEGCPDGWVTLPQQSTCYKVFFLKKDWEGASGFCKAFGNSGNLISINSTGEQMIANTLLVDALDVDDIWIGLSDKTSRGTYQWADESAVTYTNWYNGQPDDAARTTSCAAMHFANGYQSFPRWSDRDCSDKRSFICEMLKTGKSRPTNPTTTVAKGNCASGWAKYKGYCYHFHNDSMTWLDAREKCRSEGSSTDLVSIWSQEENDFVFGLLMNSSASEIWMGLTDKGIFKGQFWSDSSPVSFTRWDASEPNSYLNQLVCGVMNNNGYWRDEDCTLKSPFFCKSVPDAIFTPTTLPPSTPSTATQDPTICLKNYKHWRGNGMCYYFGNVSDARDWHQAKAACLKDGGSLTSIRDKNEQLFLQNELSRRSISRSWIGLSDLGTESGFEWTDGTPATYMNFEDGQPDDWHNMEDCVEMRYGGEWNDKVCSIKFPFVCKRNNNTVIVPTTVIATMEPDIGFCDAGWHAYGSKCYQFNTGKSNLLTWQEAKMACAASGTKQNPGDLVSIHSSYENAFVLSHLGLAMESVFIGLNDLQIERTFTWSDQSSTDYIKWFRRQPDNFDGKEDCVEFMPYFNYKGAWNDMRCDSLRGYVCQKGSSKTKPSKPTPPNDCPSNYQPYGEDCYAIKTIPMSWKDARDVCKKDHAQGELVSVHSPHEQAFLFSYFVQHATEIWIGLKRQIGGDSFGWSDRSPVDYSHWGTVGTYKSDKEYCSHSDLAKHMEGRWLSGDCSAKRKFACKVTKAGESGTPEHPGICTAGWKKLSKHCYMLSSYRGRWIQARQKCRDAGGDLVSIHNKEEQNFIQHLSRTLMESVWLGLNDRQKEMSFQWSDASSKDFTNWKGTEPNDNNGQENCAEMNSQTGKWNDNSCSNYLRYICKRSLECASALGLENGTIADASLTASSSDDTHFPALARLNAPAKDGWCANVTDSNQFLQIDLGTSQRITRIALQGVTDGYNRMYVQTYRVLYSEDGQAWKTNQLEGVDEVLAGNGAADRIDSATPQVPIAGRYLRINPLTWKRRICLKVELYGCPFVCEKPLGLETHAIQDAQMSSSSNLKSNLAAAAGRLNNPNSAWCSKNADEKQWLQVDFKRKVTISRVGTQGISLDGTYQYVSAYRLSYSDDGVTWTTYQTFSGSVRIFGGNYNSQGGVFHRITEKITARFLRFLPLKWKNGICLRAEVYGCFYECNSALGLQDELIADSAITASSSTVMMVPSLGRLGLDEATNTAWCAKINNKKQFLQVDFGSLMRITAIATQGLNADSPQYVTSYQVQSSVDGRFWSVHQSNGVIQSFTGNQNGQSTKRNKLMTPIQARLIRINPTSWQDGVCLRLEAFGCRVEQVPATSTPPSKWNYKGTFRLTSVEWDDELANEKSGKHQSLENDIEAAMTELYVNDFAFKDGFDSADVNGFRKGSVIVKFTLVFTVDDDNVTWPVVKAVKGGYLGKYKVDIDSLKIEPAGTSQGKATGNRDDNGMSHSGKVALIVVFMALIVLVIAGGLFWFYRKRSHHLGQFKPQAFENPVHYSGDHSYISDQALIDP